MISSSRHPLLPLCAFGAGAALVAGGARRGSAHRQPAAPTAVGAAARPQAAPTPGAAWVVLPTFNEAENIETITAAIVEVLELAAPSGFRVLIVDDDSPDG